MLRPHHNLFEARPFKCSRTITNQVQNKARLLAPALLYHREPLPSNVRGERPPLYDAFSARHKSWRFYDLNSIKHRGSYPVVSFLRMTQYYHAYLLRRIDSLQLWKVPPCRSSARNRVLPIILCHCLSSFSLHTSSLRPHFLAPESAKTLTHTQIPSSARIKHTLQINHHDDTQSHEKSDRHLEIRG